jgi:hypothetical protein
MDKDKSNLNLRIGVLILAFAWFSSTLYEVVLAFLHSAHPTQQVSFYILLSETAGSTGLAFRAGGSFIAFITSLSYFFKKTLDVNETLTALRLVMAFEAVYWFSLLFSVLPSAWIQWSFFTLVNNLPCTIESITLPIVLGILFFKLTPKKAGIEGIKWALISGVAYIFVFWLNNTVNWITAVYSKGLDYLLFYPANLFSFTLTVGGLFILLVFSAHFAWGTIKNGNCVSLNLRRVGLILTCFGLYFDIIFVMFLFLDAVGGWGSWYAWFFGHNMDLWLIVLPLIGLPLMIWKRKER